LNCLLILTKNRMKNCIRIIFISIVLYYIKSVNTGCPKKMLFSWDTLYLSYIVLLLKTPEFLVLIMLTFLFQSKGIRKKNDGQICVNNWHSALVKLNQTYFLSWFISYWEIFIMKRKYTASILWWNRMKLDDIFKLPIYKTQ
jgi:hypothetical protein